MDAPQIPPSSRGRSRSLRRARTAVRAAGILGTVVIATTAHAVAAADAPPDVIALGQQGTAAIHGDAASTDTIPGRGPGTGPGVDHTVRASIPGATCSSVFVGSDGMPVALCTAYLGLQPNHPPTPMAPTVVLFDPHTAQPLASLQLPKGSLLGGVYGFLDATDRVIVGDGNGDVHAVGHVRDAPGGWRLVDDVVTNLGGAIPPGDALAGLLADDAGRIWFATAGARVGTVRPGVVDSVRWLDLGAGERITNGLTLRPGGASIITSHALYELGVGADGTPTQRWRHAYDRGAARHPGMLAWGSGTTPTYFRVAGRQLVAFADAAERSDLFVLDADTGEVRCRMPAFATTLDPGSAGPDGVVLDGPGQTENSVIALPRRDGDGFGLIYPNTYGFQYVPLATDGPSRPESAPYTGGITRVDVTADGCARVWTSTARTATLPQATTGDRLVHSLAYGPVPDLPPGGAEFRTAGLAQKFDAVYYSALDADTGAERAGSFVGLAPVDEPMELTGTVAPADGSAPGLGNGPGVMWQPTMGRMLRIGPS